MKSVMLCFLVTYATMPNNLAEPSAPETDSAMQQEQTNNNQA
jgi:hypothetical protein